LPVPDPINKEKNSRMCRRGEAPLREALYRLSGVDLTNIDGISPQTAEKVLSELGSEGSHFPDEKHFVASLNLAPKISRSGGKLVKKRRHNHATNRVGQALKQAASTLKHSKTALGAEYRRIARRKGAGVAVLAIARKLAVLIYRMLRWGQRYVDEGQEAYGRRFDVARLRACKANAKNLGYKLLAINEIEACP